MNAVISGSAGLALIVDGQSGFLISLDAPDEMVAVDVAHAYRHFRDARDTQFVEGYTRPQIVARLEQSCNEAQALDVALILLDAELSDDCRQEAARELEELLESDETRTYLDRVFRGRPFVADNDVAGALRCSRDAQADASWIFFDTLRVLQPFITQVWAAWESIPRDVIPVERRRTWTSLVVREGIFDELVQTLASGGHLAQIFESTSISIARKIPTWDEVRRTWKDQVWLHARTAKSRLSLDAIYQAMDEIVLDMERHRWDDAREKIAELVSEEIACGDVEGAIKSLCSLAKKAQDRGFGDFQRELTAEAVNLGPFDVRAWTQHGKALLDAGDLKGSLNASDRALAIVRDTFVKISRAGVLKSLGYFNEAISAYESVLAKQPDNVIAKRSRAEALKGMRRYPEALAAYKLIIAQYPDDVVAKNGRAALLKTMGRYPEALAAYDSATAEHADNVHAKTGRAEVLKAMGRYPEALAAYDSATAEHTDNVYAKTGRAEVLKAMGRYPEALAAYELVISQHPDNAVAKTGLAGILVAMKKYNEALAALPTVPVHTPQYWICLHVRGMIHLRMGDLDEAAQIFNDGLREAPTTVDRDYFRNGLAATRIRDHQYADACALLAEVTTPELQPQANVLRTHAYGVLEDDAHAREAYSRLPEKGIPLLVDIRDELRRHFIDHVPANWQLEELLDHEIEFLMAA